MIAASRRWLAALALVAVAACDGSPTNEELFAPTGLVATPTGPSSVRVSFNAVPDASGYDLERATGTSTDWTKVATVQSVTYDDTGLLPETSYRYRVAALKGSGRSDFGPEAMVATSNRPEVALSSDFTSNRRLHADTLYVLNNWVHVANGATLTVDAGTRIEGNANSALFVLRGAKILAVGTEARPIVFTSHRAAGQRQPGDWGGLILVGNGIINRGDPVILEGSNTGGSNVAVNYAGGTSNADDSGELRYVRIEFAGFGPVPDAELNSLTLAAVGSGTRINYVQTMAGLDDSFEWFGGAVDAKYLVSYESGDDHFDASEGFVGRNQFLIALQSTILTPRAGSGNSSTDPQGFEVDGCSGANCIAGQSSQPHTIPVFANFTMNGTGPGVVPAAGGFGGVLRRGAGGFYVNGIIARWPGAALAIRDAATNDRITAGDLSIRNVLAAENGTLFESGSGRFTVDAAANAIETSPSATASLFGSFDVSRGAAGLDWHPSVTSAARTGGLATFTGTLATKAGTAVTGTTYRGAADPAGARWWANWTTYVRN
ncbi:MAG TPA: fibronectin type III domain-containing protein [Longimicrobium sp.]